MRVQKLSTVQVLIRVFFVSGSVCLIAALCCAIFLDKDYRSSVKRGSIIPPQSAERSPGILSRCMLDRQ